MADADKDEKKEQKAPDAAPAADATAPEERKEGPEGEQPATDAKATDPKAKPESAVPTVPNKARQYAPDPNQGQPSALSGFAPSARDMAELAAKLEKATYKRVNDYLTPPEPEKPETPASAPSKKAEPGADGQQPKAKSPDDLLKAGSEAQATVAPTAPKPKFSREAEDVEPVGVDPVLASLSQEHTEAGEDSPVSEPALAARQQPKNQLALPAPAATPKHQMSGGMG